MTTTSSTQQRNHVIREAVLSDVPDLVQLSRTVALSTHTQQGDDLDKTGFLVSDFTTQDYTHFLETAQHFLVLRMKGENQDNDEDGTNEPLAAFLLAYGSESITPDQELNTHIKQVLYPNKPFVLIKQIVVSHQFRRQGLAQTLYQTLYERMPEYYKDEFLARPMYTAIVAEPNNPISIAFHNRLGFEQADIYTPKQDPKARYIFCNQDVPGTLEKLKQTANNNS